MNRKTSTNPPVSFADWGTTFVLTFILPLLTHVKKSGCSFLSLDNLTAFEYNTHL